MATRTNLRPHAVLIDESMAADITSEPTILQSLTGVGYQLTWTGTSPVGDLYVQVSNDYSLNAMGDVENSGTWTNLTLSVNGSPEASIAITGNSGNGFIDIEKTMAYAIRLFYDRTSGTGSLSAVITGKVC